MYKTQFLYTGEFGVVYRALYSPNSDFNSTPQQVAVKKLKGLLFTITLLILHLVCIMYSLFTFTMTSR